MEFTSAANWSQLIKKTGIIKIAFHECFFSEHLKSLETLKNKEMAQRAFEEVHVCIPLSLPH